MSRVKETTDEVKIHPLSEVSLEKKVVSKPGRPARPADEAEEQKAKELRENASPTIVLPKESVTEFQARARGAFARTGGYFDFGDWLHSTAHLSLDNMSHSSWAPYLSVLREKVAQLKKKAELDDSEAE